MTDFLRKSSSRRRIQLAVGAILAVMALALAGFALRGLIGL